MSHDALLCGIILTKFELGQSWLITFILLMR